MAPASDASSTALARVRAALEESARVTRETLAACEGKIAEAAELLAEALERRGQVLAFGNGGSASDAQHLAAELAGRFDRERPGLPAIALNANASTVTAIGNDYGFEHAFARQIEAHGRSGDVAVAISTSGKSANVNAAARTARERGLATIGLTGKSGGELASLVDVAIVVPADATARIQEAHIAICHAWCEIVDATLFPEGA